MWHERSGQLILGVMVRTLGAFPSGWRMPGAHLDPADDAAALRRVATVAEGAALDFLFFGDWLSTDADLELTDPHLIARPDPLSTAAYLAAVTQTIGLVGSASVAHTEPYAVARTAASIDVLSGGRFGLNLLIGSDGRASANFAAGSERLAHDPGEVRGLPDRHAVAEEYVWVLRALWGSVQPGLFVGDQAGGRLIDPSLMSTIDHLGGHYSVRGPLNTPQPVQEQLPLAVAGAAPRTRAFAAAAAELYLASPPGLGEAIKTYRDLSVLVAAAGRGRGDLKIVAPVLPIVGKTREAAFDLYDRLVALVQLQGERADDTGPGHPVAGADRSAARITQLVGLPLSERGLDEPVTLGDAERFNGVGRRLLEVDSRRSGRTVGSRRPPTYRHLLVAHLVDAPIVVGSAADIADHLELWYRSSAVDGFTVLSAFLHEQFESFVELVVPELRARGLFRDAYDGQTLRAHLRSAAPPADRGVQLPGIRNTH